MTLHSTACHTPFTRYHNLSAQPMTPLIPTNAQLKALTRQAALQDYGPSLERICRGLAVAIALAYATGWLLGTWVHQSSTKLGHLTARQAVRETCIDDPQPALPFIDAPLPTTPQEAMPPVVVRTTVSKLPIPAPKPSRKRSSKAAAATGFKAAVT